MTISQIVLFPNPLNVFSIDSVPVNAVTANAKIAIAPIGKGLEIKPIIVATKIANKCHALGSSPDGAGINQMINPTATVISKGMIFTACCFLRLFLKPLQVSSYFVVFHPLSHFTT